MKYEIKKVIKQKLLWISVGVMIVLYLVMGIYNVNIKYMTKIDESHLIRSQQELFQNVSEYRSNVVKNAKRLSHSKQTYTSNLNEKLLEIYSEPIEFRQYDSRCIETVVLNNGGIGMVLCIFICCMFTLKIFYTDTENDMMGIIASSPKGKSYIFRKKWMSIILCEVFMLVIVYIVRMIPLLMYGELSDFLNPIQSIDEFAKSPYNISILEYYLVTMVTAFIEITIIVSIAVIMVNIFKDIIIPIVGAILLSAMSMVICIWMILSLNGDRLVNSTNVIHSIMLEYTPMAYIHSVMEYFVQASYINFINIPISLLSISLIVNSIICIMTIFIGYAFYVRRQKICV